MKKNLAVLFVVLLSAFLGFESFLRLTGYEPWVRTQPGEIRNGPDIDKWYEVSNEFGWVYNRRSAHHHLEPENHIDVTYRANRHGFRDSDWPDFAEGAPEPKKIMIFGDSLTAGYGVSEEERFSSVLKELFGADYAVYNLAVAGWGLDQMLLAFQKYVPKLKPDVAVVVYINNDLLRAVEAYRRFEQLVKPSFEIKRGALSPRLPGGAKPPRDFILNKVYAVNFFRKTVYRFLLGKWLGEKLVDSMARIARDHEVKLVFVRLPAQDAVVPANDTAARTARLGRYLHNALFGVDAYIRKQGINYIDLTMPLRNRLAVSDAGFHFPSDAHLNRLGHRAVAEILFEHLAAEVKGRGRNTFSVLR